MKKVGYVFSLIGGLLAIIFSMLLPVTGSALYAGDDIYDFAEANQDDLAVMWITFGSYNEIDPFLQGDLKDYIEDYSREIVRTDARDLEKMGEETGVGAFEDMAHIYRNVQAFLPKLRIGMIACLIAAVIAMVGAQVAMRWRVAGCVMVLFGAAATLVFSLIASSIVPMAAASLLLIIGGVLQLVRKTPRKPEPDLQSSEEGAI